MYAVYLYILIFCFLGFTSSSLEACTKYSDCIVMGSTQWAPNPTSLHPRDTPYLFKTLTINKGATLTISGNGNLYIKALDSITINGTINLKGKGIITKDTNPILEIPTWLIETKKVEHTPRKGVDGNRGYSGQNGGSGLVAGTSVTLESFNGFNENRGAGGNGGGGGDPGVGGNPGGILYLEAPTITINGVINVSGGNGTRWIPWIH